MIDTSRPDSVSDSAPNTELPIARRIFTQVWADLEDSLKTTQWSVPARVLWLNGAPGAGKGTQTHFLQKHCGITAQPIIISDLLQTDRAKQLKAVGQLVDDAEVTKLMLQALLQPACQDGVIVDGYPRTQVQAECLKFLQKKLQRIDEQNKNQVGGHPRSMPDFHIVVLWVDEAVSIERQLLRGRRAQAHNATIEGSGGGCLRELRPTDIDAAAAAKRYRVFRETTYQSLLSLKNTFHYHAIDATGSIAEVQEQIRKIL